MDDLIRRQDAIDEVYKASGIGGALKALKCLPTAQQWTPCSDRPPEENEFYLATIYSEEMQTIFRDKLFYGAPQLCGDKKIGWYFMHENGDVEQVFNVKAWMPLPEPYKEEKE